MVNQTFKNLSKEKQNNIIQIAFEEFALKGYQNTSLSIIIKKVGVAKGSFYRYFSSKRDLFSYLLEVGTGLRYANLDKIVKHTDIDFFDLIKLNYKAIIESDKKNPAASGFLFQVMHERDNSEVFDIIETLYSGVIDRINNLLEIPKFKNELNIVDPDFTAFHIFYSQLWFYDYIAYKYKLNYEENIKNHQPILNLADEELDKVINMSVDVLKFGLMKVPHFHNNPIPQ